MDKRDPNPQLPRRNLYAKIWDVNKAPPAVERQSTLRQVATKLTPAANKAANEAVSKVEARKVYMRELMRKRRAAVKAGDL